MYSFESCRICLQQKPGQNLKSTSLVNEDDGITFLEHLEYCVNEVNCSSDDFPSLLCDDCIKDLLGASKFKFRCIQSDVYRQKYIEEHAWKSNLNKAILFDSGRFEVIDEKTVGNEDSQTNDKAKEEYIEEQSDLSKTAVVNLVIASVEEIKEEPVETNDNNCDIKLKIDIEETKVECNETSECIEKQEKKAKTVCLSFIDKNISLCSICNRTFSRKSLCRHLRDAHNVKKEEKPTLPSFIDKDKCFCTLCNRTYTRKTLWQHVRHVHTSEKNYKCDICSEAFTTSRKLRRHKSNHTGKLDHVCYVCGKMFLLPDQLKCHLETHETQKKYKCDLCDKSFKLRPTLRIHKQNVHTDRENWKYLCTHCGKKFVSRTLLGIHVKRLHLNLKDYACPLCDKKFFAKGELEIHRLKHSNVKLHKCEICGTEYKLKANLKRHVKIKHGIRTAKEMV